MSTTNHALFKREDHPQDVVLQNYTQAFNGNTMLADNLRMLFTPFRIPVGLACFEAKFCARILCPLKKFLLKHQIKKRRAQIKALNLQTTENQISAIAYINSPILYLPKEFSPDTPMTHKKFWIGAMKFIFLFFK